MPYHRQFEAGRCQASLWDLRESQLGVEELDTRREPDLHRPYEAGVTTCGSMTNYNPNNSNDVSLRRNLGYALNYANRMDLAAMVPRSDLASTGYCLANASDQGEYLAYQPGFGSFTVNLSATPGTLDVEWLTPATGTIATGNAVSEGTTRTMTLPFRGDAVLYLRSGMAFAQPTITDLIFTPKTVKYGQSSQGLVRISQPAPSGGQAIEFTSSMRCEHNKANQEAIAEDGAAAEPYPVLF